MEHSEKRKINCRECIYYYITWDTGNPYGCRAMGFKGKQMPSITVFNSTGQSCMLFEKKIKNRSNS